MNDSLFFLSANEEALAIELIMARYCFAFASYNEAEPLVNFIREKLPLTFKPENDPSEKYL